MTLERFDRGERALDPIRQLGASQITQVVRGERREQPHADIRRRRSVRDAHLRCELHVVGRQPVILPADETIEIVPGPARDAAQLCRVPRAQDQSPRNHRPTQPPRHQRRGQPRGQERQRQRQRAGAQWQHAEQHSQSRRRAGPHLGDEHARALTREQPGGACRCGRGGLPLEQPALRDHHPNQGQDDSVHHLVGVAREQHDLEQHLCTRRLQFRPHVLQVHAERLLRTWAAGQVHQRR